MKKLIDANLLIRYFVNDDPKKALAVQGLLKRTKDTLVLTDIVVAELVWVLTSFYNLTKEEIVEKISSLITFEKIASNNQILTKALLIYKTTNVDFIDAYLASYAQEENIPQIYSYDKHFDKIPSLRRVAP